ncbi:hypothetical protein BN961_00181 [Afipia felis]|uniref:NAD-specific glutamate dehydrogenase n=1 Tax=Afipia felis TaxID=1035 RepID=A0A090MGQ8_AFIFE|nr:hypothetical protein BN961_00181 [Afipia felis]
MAGKAVEQAGVDVGILVSLDPGACLHLGLTDQRAGFDRSVDLVAGAVEEAGVDEADALGCVLDAVLEVDGGAAFLVHDADLERVGRQRQHFFHASEQTHGQRHFIRAMQLRLDDINRTSAAVAALLQIMQREQRGDGGIENAFGNLMAGCIEHGVRVHVDADIAHQHQAAAGERDFLAVAADIGAVVVQFAMQRLTALAEFGFQRALHQAKGVAIDQDFVLGIDGGDAVLHVENRRHRGFDDNVVDAGGIVLSDRGRAVDLDIDVQAVVDQQDRRRGCGIAAMADELGRVLQRG